MILAVKQHETRKILLSWCKQKNEEKSLKADFHSVEFSDWTGNPLFTCENVALNLIRMFPMTKTLLCQIQSGRKILLSGNQPTGKPGLIGNE